MLSLELSLLGLKEQNQETKAEIGLIGARFLCKSCESPIVMTFQRLVYVVSDSGSLSILTYHV